MERLRSQLERHSTAMTIHDGCNYRLIGNGLWCRRENSLEILRVNVMKKRGIPKILSKINLLLTFDIPPPTLQGAGVGASTLSLKCQRKFPQSLQTVFKKWIFKNISRVLNHLCNYGRNLTSLLCNNLPHNI